MANILFLHTNFPAQFKVISKIFARDGHNVKFICKTHYNRTVKGVERICIKSKINSTPEDNSELTLVEKTRIVSEEYKSVFQKLASNGYTPDIIISHSGWGCGYYAKSIWPSAFIISYCEWWFDLASEIFTYDKNNKYLPFQETNKHKYCERNALMGYELINSDLLVSPTEWQKKQLPKLMSEHCKVIFDGIELHKIEPKSDYNAEKLILTYGTRGMEPIRGFPQFIKALPIIVRQFPDIEVQIAGEDIVSYGGKNPSNGSWKKWAIDYLEINNCKENVKWLGYLGRNDYYNWLKSSDCHVYLSHPFVISWSLLDAIACNSNIVASDIEAVNEYNFGGTLRLVDHRNHRKLCGEIINCLANRSVDYKEMQKLREAGLKSLASGACYRAWAEAAGLEVHTRH